MSVPSPPQKRRVNTAVVIPAYNEEENIARVLHQLTEAYFERPSLFQKIIVVDDGSRDNTKNIVKKFITNRFLHNLVELIELPKNEGKARAFYEGLKRADELKAEKLVMLDADNKNLNARNIAELKKPLGKKSENARYEVSMSVGGREGEVEQGAKYLNGERAFLMKMLRNLLRKPLRAIFENPSIRIGFGLEYFLNYFFTGNQFMIKTANPRSQRAIFSNASFTVGPPSYDLAGNKVRRKGRDFEMLIGELWNMEKIILERTKKKISRGRGNLFSAKNTKQTKRK